jgi:hypothetical protein
MKLNRAELKKIIYDFNSVASRLLKADWQEYNSIMAKFLAFVEKKEVIWDYVSDCGSATFDVEAEIAEVARSYGRSYFELGDTSEEENANIYHILRYAIDSKTEIARTIAMSYVSGSNKWQDMIKGFNERVVMVLIRNIEGYLTKVGIDMGIDDTIRYNITVNNGQVNLASDNAVINATVNNGLNQAELKSLLDKVLEESKTNLSDDDQISVQESIEVVGQELLQDNPKKTILRKVLLGLQAINGTAQFAAAVVALIQFVTPLIG